MDGPAGALRRILAHLGRLAGLRAELAAEELDAARAQWLVWLAAAVGAVALGAIALSLAAAALTVALWPRYGWGTPVVLAVGFALAAAMAVRWLAASIRRGPRLLEVTRREFAADLEGLLGNGRAAPSRGDEANPPR